MRVAGRLGELSLVRAAFAEGRLSYSKVRAISRVAGPDNEADLLELALHATAAQLERIVRAYRRGAAVGVEQANQAHRERFVSWSWDDDGSLLFHGRLPAEDGELLLRALEAAREAPESPGSGEPSGGARVSAETPPPGEPVETSSGLAEDDPRPAQSNADALVSVADASLAAREATRSGGDRYQLVVHADADADSLSRAQDDSGAEPTAAGELERGGPIAAETVRRIACDASVVVISERNGRPLDVGRKTRTIPAALRRALRSRDRCCRFPGCTQHHFVDAHHIHHWAHGGDTALDNLTLLCRRHHRLLHEGGYQVKRRHDGGLDFKRRDGTAILPRPRRHAADGRDIARANRRAGLEIDPQTPVALSHGDRFSLDLTVGGLVARSP